LEFIVTYRGNLAILVGYLLAGCIACLPIFSSREGTCRGGKDFQMLEIEVINPVLV